jgi:hypothetical protein
MSTRKEHWERIYSTKPPDVFSWTQKIPETSLAFIRNFNLAKDARIIDVGGGDSRLVDFLLVEGYSDITVLDISKKAIDRARRRLGANSDRLKWIECDVTEFDPVQTYDCWHDRATFHFLTEYDEVEKYLETARKAVSQYLVIGTFSDKGPEQCSMLNVHRYAEPELQIMLQNGFEKIKCVTEDHMTPFDSKQNFLFCSFRRSNR